jgi:hypothetical protein
MLELLLIGVATGIVSRLAKGRGRDPVLFGMLTAITAIAFAFAGTYLFGFVGDLLGIFLGGVLVEEVVRNMPAKQPVKRQVYCSQCGFQQDWAEAKLCEKCGLPLHK